MTQMKTVGVGFYWDDLEVGDRFRTLNRTITPRRPAR